MKHALLARILGLRSAKATFTVATDLGNGNQSLVTADGSVEDFGLQIDDEVRREALAVMKEDRGRTIEAGNRPVFLNPFNPPRRMIIVGAVHIAQSLAPMATIAGYEVTVIDPRGAWATSERFPETTLDRRWPDEALEALAPDSRTAIVTLTHDPKLDDPALKAALNTDAFYIGALGSTNTHAKRVQRLQTAGLDDATIDRIDGGPVGMDIGARTPAEIALSILASATFALRGHKHPRGDKPA